MTMQKRQRELKRAEKAARKRAKRHGHTLHTPPEPVPSIDISGLTEDKTTTDEETPESPENKEEP
jgi:hypothetical protein